MGARFHVPTRDLCGAVLFGDVAGAERALDAGASANALDRDFPDEWTVFRGHPRGASILHQAAGIAADRPGNRGVAIVRLLLSRGAAVDARDWLGNTPLHEAAIRNSCAAAAALIERHADVNALNHAGQPPLHLAGYWKAEGVIDVLLAKGANPLLKDRGNFTPASFCPKLAAAANRELLRGQAFSRHL